MENSNEKSANKGKGDCVIVTMPCPLCGEELKDVDFMDLTENDSYECPHCRKSFDPADIKPLRDHMEFIVWCYDTHDRIVREKKEKEKAKRKK